VSLSGKVVLVSGAGSGIGRAVACALLAAGGEVVAVGRRAATLQALGDRPLAVPADVGAPEAAERAVTAALERFGRLDGLVNNAGIARFAPIEAADLADFDAMLDANLRGPVYLIRAALPALRERGGAIVNVSSVGGVLAMPGRSLYGATKAALNSLTRSLARELAPEVRVNAVLPGPVDTPIYDHLGLTDDQCRTLRRDLLASVPLSRFGRPEEVADWVCRLLDADVAGWVTGSLLTVDGGRTA
jgi:NAD(P)-dependent dehydrogenase (short-subunit alcohol dehydrogenase family)